MIADYGTKRFSRHGYKIATEYTDSSLTMENAGPSCFVLLSLDCMSAESKFLHTSLLYISLDITNFSSFFYRCFGLHILCFCLTSTGINGPAVENVIVF